MLAYDWDRYPVYPAVRPEPKTLNRCTQKLWRTPSLTPVPERPEYTELAAKPMPNVHKPLPSPPFDLEAFVELPKRVSTPPPVFAKRQRIRVRPDSPLTVLPCDWLPLPKGVARLPGQNFF